MVTADDAERSRRWTGLMERVQQGDQQAFRALFEELGPAVTRFVRRRISDSAEVEDVVQEALIAVFKSRHTYQPDRLFEPWLFAIVRNVVSRSLGATFERLGWQETVAELPETAAESHFSPTLELRQAFEQLSPMQREAVRLTKLEGHSIEEASRMAGTSVASMKVRIHRAYQALKESLRR